MSSGVAPRHSRIGRYEIANWLGSGSFAAVYLGYDPALDVPVAVKVLGDHHSADPNIRERFIQEARMLRRLTSDRLVTVRDIGEVDGQPYFVMDAFELGTLEKRLASSKTPPTIHTIRHLIDELELCLSAVHDGGLIHRDLKPSNLLIGGGDLPWSGSTLLDPTERLVLGDFGIARSADASGLTQGAGTHGFMAPEQEVVLTTVDQRADIYGATAIVRLILHQVWPAHELPSGLGAALARGMAASPDDRPSTATEWAAMLHSALPDPTPQADTEVMNRSRRRKLLLPAAVVGLVALVAVLVSSMGSSGPEILGPDQVRLGTTGVYSFQAEDGASYVWTDSSGGTHDSPALEIRPRSTGTLQLTLEETIDGTTTSTTMQVEVLGP